MSTTHSDQQVQEALADYVRNDTTTKELARRYKVSAATLTVWAQNANIPLRVRGRRKQDEPTERQRQILEMCETSTQEEAGRRFGMFKQSVQRLCKRWKNYSKPKKPPFEPGDVIKWKGRKLTVVAASLHTGTLVDSKDRMMFQFRWNQRGYMPKKAGRNEKYAVNGHRMLQTVAA